MRDRPRLSFEDLTESEERIAHALAETFTKTCEDIGCRFEVGLTALALIAEAICLTHPREDYAGYLSRQREKIGDYDRARLSSPRTN